MVSFTFMKRVSMAEQKDYKSTELDSTFFVHPRGFVLNLSGPRRRDIFLRIRSSARFLFPKTFTCRDHPAIWVKYICDYCNKTWALLFATKPTISNDKRKLPYKHEIDKKGGIVSRRHLSKNGIRTPDRFLGAHCHTISNTMAKSRSRTGDPKLLELSQV